MKRIQVVQASIIALGLLTFAGCASHSHPKDSTATADAPTGKTRESGIAVLSPGANGKVRGTVTFREETEGVRVTASIEGLAPGLHGFHIHEKGDCSAADFSSAGPHFNPTAGMHGSPTDPQHHSGDFGNIEANAQGVARYERVFGWLTFKGTNSIIGHAVIVHEKADDLKSQPAGNAGARLACGVIQSTH